MYNVYMFGLSNISYLSGNAVVPLSKLVSRKFPFRPPVFKRAAIKDNHVLTVKGGDFRVKC